LLELARAGDGGAYERAREPLEHCRKADPESADCTYLLGEVELAADHPLVAAELYTVAVRLDPQQARYYEPLAALYRVFKQPLAAEMVLVEGLQRVPVSAANRAELAAMALGAARLAAGRHDGPAAQAWLDRAESLADETSPELLFQLASFYASAVLDAAGPREKAVRLLTAFVKRVCRGAVAAKYKDECWVSEGLIQRLDTGDSAVPPVASPRPQPVAPVALSPGMPVAHLELQPLRVGDAYTVWGASYLFRSGVHTREVTAKPIAITGYIVKTNLGEAPRCAVHRSGIADPENCRANIPAFWLGDRPDAAEGDCIKVMGFASNYAQLFEAIRQADSSKPDVPYQDEYWGQTIPNPLPVAGAKVTVRGKYGPSFAKASAGAEMDSTMGLLDFIDRDLLAAGPELATLPGVKRRK
jgi:tetratricopeptide (TPR) repeat protein